MIENFGISYRVSIIYLNKNSVDNRLTAVYRFENSVGNIWSKFNGVSVLNAICTRHITAIVKSQLGLPAHDAVFVFFTILWGSSDRQSSKVLKTRSSSLTNIAIYDLHSSN